MARGIAHVTLVGNLTRDPELRQTPNGTSVCQLGVAVNSSYKDSSGQWVEKPNFFDVVVWGHPGRELRQVPQQGQAGSGRRAPGPAVLGCSRRHQAQQGGDHRRHGDVHRRPERDARAGGSRQASSRRATQPRRTIFEDIDFGGDDIPF